MCVLVFCFSVFFLMIRRPPRTTLPATPFPFPTRFRSENRKLAQRQAEAPLPGVVTSNPDMLQTCRDIAGLATTNVSVLIVGESGTGKELLARALHQFSPRAKGRSEEHTSELQSLMRISYAVFCLQKKKKKENTHNITHDTTYT